MLEDLVKLIEKEFVVELTNEEKEELQYFLDDKVDTTDIAWWLVDELELSRRENRTKMKELLDKFLEENKPK